MRGSKNHAAIALTIRAIRAMRQGNIKSGQCPHPVIHKRLFGIIFNLFLTTMSSVYGSRGYAADGSRAGAVAPQELPKYEVLGKHAV